jgi:hypothetical protein
MTTKSDLITTIASTPGLSGEYARRLHSRFTEWSKLRDGKEKEWLRSLRQFKGIYDPEDLARIEKNASKVYPKITRAKVRKLLSRLRQILFPSTELNWTIDPTPNPTLPEEIERAIAQALFQSMNPPQEPQEQGEAGGLTGFQGQGSPPPPEPRIPTGDEILAAVMQFARATSEAMKTEIQDQLAEMNYEEEVGAEVLRSGIMYGTGCAKGILVSKRKIKKYDVSPTGDWKGKVVEVKLPAISFTPIWNYYPDMSSQTQEGCQGEFERHVLSKSQLLALASRSDFESAAIKTYLRDNPDGDCEYTQWERDLMILDTTASGSNIIRIDGSTEKSGTHGIPRGRRYEVLEYWGTLDSREVEEIGGAAPEEESYTSDQINAWVLGGSRNGSCLIKSSLNELSNTRSPFNLFFFESDESSIFGDGLPKVMRDSQSAMCSSSRMVLDNGAICAGPQLEVNVDLLAQGVDYTSMHARKMWLREGTGMDAQYAALRNIQIDSHIPELISIFNLFREIGNEETALPENIGTEPGNNETVGAMSMRMGQLNVSVLDIARNFDKFTEGIIDGMYHWNMDFNDKAYIKGDYEVQARGSASLVMKEVRMQALVQLKSVLDPDDWSYIKRKEWIGEVFKAHDIPTSLLRSEEERADYIEKVTDQKLQDLQYAQMEAEIEYRKASALHMVAKSKEKEAEIGVNDGTDETERMMAYEDQRRLNEKHAADLMALENKQVLAEQKHKINTALTIGKGIADLNASREQSTLNREIATSDMTHNAIKTAADVQGKQEINKAKAESIRKAPKIVKVASKGGAAGGNRKKTP